MVAIGIQATAVVGVGTAVAAGIVCSHVQTAYAGQAGDSRKNAAQSPPQSIIDGAISVSDSAVVAIGGRRIGCGDALAPHCSGVLVAPRVVVTAAHCVSDPRLGSDLEILFAPSVEDARAEVVGVSSVAIHPGYDGQVHDIALAILDRVASVAPLPLPSLWRDDELMGAQVRVVGFGKRSIGDEDIGTRQSGTARIDEVSAASFRIVADPAMTCHGDSGGPALMEVNGSAVLVGITAKGDAGCAEYGIETRVDYYISDFIDPWITSAANMPLPPSRQPVAAVDQLCTAVCRSDIDCPEGLKCQPSPSDSGTAHRCVIPGVLPGAFGALCVASEADVCGGVDGIWNGCMRMGSDGDCRCYRACEGTLSPVPGPMSPDMIDTPASGGCRVGDDRGAWQWAWGLMLIVGYWITRVFAIRARNFRWPHRRDQSRKGI